MLKSTYIIQFHDKKENFPLMFVFLGCRKNFLGTQTRVRVSHGKTSHRCSSFWGSKLLAADGEGGISVFLLFLHCHLLFPISTGSLLSLINYSWLLLSRLRLSRITACRKVKIWSLFKHENLTWSYKMSNFSSFPQYFQYISNFRSQITYSFVKWGCSTYFSSVP